MIFLYSQQGKRLNAVDGCISYDLIHWESYQSFCAWHANLVCLFKFMSVILQDHILCSLLYNGALCFLLRFILDIVQ
uniref:Putative ovule protein n=1 Tax=Solanum chacoense TaxID=4108 RepID=A0A0V0HJF2_SOLCH